MKSLYTILKSFFILMLILQFNLVFAQSKTEDVKFPLEILQISDDPAIQSSILLADKNERKLYFFESEQSLATPQSFEIDIGKNDGDKVKRNDQRTPEGIYILQKKLTQPEIPFDLYGSLAFTTNYPNVFDKFENKTGSGIWLHSVPDSVPLNRGSRGCVVLRNDNIIKLSDQIALNKSHLIINAKTSWVNLDEHQTRKNRILSWINNWKNHWQNQDLENYINLYSEEFSAPSFNKQSWLKHKEKLKSLYSTIQIDFSKPSIFHMKNQYLVRFVQNYSSDKYNDKGIKTLYLLETGDRLEILREEWSSLP